MVTRSERHALRRGAIAAAVIAAFGISASWAGVEPTLALGDSLRPNAPPAGVSATVGPRGQRNRRAGVARPAAVQRPAATVSVTNCSDSGPGSLREALVTAADGDVIDLTATGCPTITLTSGALSFSANVTMQGPGRDALAIDGGGTSSLLEHAGTVLEIHDLTLRNGFYASGFGGCTWILGDLTMTGSRVTGCQAGDGTNRAAYGAALDLLGSLHLEDSIITGNESVSSGVYGSEDDGAFGGGIYVYGDASIYDSTVGSNLAHAIGGKSLGGGVFGKGLLYFSGSDIGGNEASSVEAFARGGGIFSQHDLTLFETSLTDNHVDSVEFTAYGGGAQANGMLFSLASVVSGNIAHSDQAWSYGGGLHAGDLGDNPGDSEVGLLYSTISGNQATSNCNSCYLMGGGVSSFGVASAKYSTISDNSVVASMPGASVQGGGVANMGGNLNYAIGLNSSTVSGNRVEGPVGGTGLTAGGGISTMSGGTRIRNSTIAFNTAGSQAGGAALSASSGVVNEITSSLVVNNIADLGADLSPNPWPVSSPLTVSGDHNMVMDVDPLITLPGDTLVGDPLLLPLADNGGWTWTHALAAASPVIDQGSNPDDRSSDQRGGDYLREWGGGPDIGAYELQPEPVSDTIFENGFD